MSKTKSKSLSNTAPNMSKDFYDVLFNPSAFIKFRFLKLSTKRILFLSFFSICFGLTIGSLFQILLSGWLNNDFLQNQEHYKSLLLGLGVNEKSFADIIYGQWAYAYLLIILSPVIAYMAPHILGGSLFLFLKIFTYSEKKLELEDVIKISRISLCPVAFYALAFIGPWLSLFMIFFMLRKLFLQQYKLEGFPLVVSIICSFYISFFISTATFQILALPIADFLR